MRSLLSSFLALLSLTSASHYKHQSNGSPTAVTCNGTTQGRYLEEFHQDLFLGVPFAEAPRLDNPRPISQRWKQPFDATKYGTTCYGLGSNKVLNLTQGEDCLNLNVVRPTGYAHDSLPVLVWIYGGGFTQGSNADPMWNLSYIVQTSVENEQPIIAVSINYRLSFLGFPVGNETLEAGVANLGLKDQRIALQWVQENIAAFGGDPNKVTAVSNTDGQDPTNV
jgi:carboxylesterase type B